MFLTFQKISTASPDRKTPIIINSEALLMLEQQVFTNTQMGGQYTATRVEVIGFPHYSFHTPTPLNVILGITKTIDLTQGVSAGSECAGTPGVLNVVRPAVSLPLVKTKSVFNYSATEYKEYVFNPNFLVYAEEVKYGGQGNSEFTGLMISLRDSSMRQVLTQLPMSDLIALLSPTTVPLT